MFKQKKSLGQNFIKDKQLIKKIIELSEFEKDSLIIEIGPGKGVLTKELIKKGKKVICFEIDKSLDKYLKEIENNNSNCQIIYQDFLKIKLEEYIDDEYKNIYCIGNIPYYITKPILMKIHHSKIKFNNVIIMLQKEVGDRLCAQPNSRSYGFLSVFFQYYYKIEKLLFIKKDFFYPKPKVDSVLLSFQRKPDDKTVINEAYFLKLIKDSFVFKRKTLVNNLKEYDQQKLKNFLKENKMSHLIRGEEMSLEEFISLANYFTCQATDKLS